MERVQFIFFITDGYKESFSILTKGEERKSPSGYSIHGLLQARILEQVDIPFSSILAWRILENLPTPGIKPWSPALQADSLPS